MNTPDPLFPCGQFAAPTWSRRDFLRRSALGFGSLAFAGLSSASAPRDNPLAPKAPHFPARAKRVIMLFMEGAPSHIDTLDYKPQLVKRHGEPLPESAIPKPIRDGKGENLKNFGTIYGPVRDFKQRGQSGLWISDALPHLAAHADDLCVLNGMVCDSNEHGTGAQQFHTGMPVLPRPSMGAWLMYGLGTENQNLPGFVVVSPPAGVTVNCGTDFLPGVYQSTVLRDADKAGGNKIAYLADKDLPLRLRRSQIDFVQELNRRHAAAGGGESALDSLIAANELAYRMQIEAPDVLDLEKESAATKALYGIGEDGTDGFGRQCLLARRLAEAGVRFIQLTSKGWDHHGKISINLPQSCRKIDKPIAGLLADLKARGLLDDTLVIWSGEFGRTPNWQSINNAEERGEPPGRGHNSYGWSLWMAGGGLRRGFRHGETDEFGYSAVSGRVHVHDLHATILHLLGLDHERLTYNFGGRNYRLTDVYGHVVKEIIA